MHWGTFVLSGEPLLEPVLLRARSGRRADCRAPTCGTSRWGESRLLTAAGTGAVARQQRESRSMEVTG
ncbi:hypothetical protein [Nonomuraea dietziae]|uniref:hypothetical protein n=1 Tax=Nonomuraea dietziae TaxID=65515 RepID=UPI0031D24092